MGEEDERNKEMRTRMGEEEERKEMRGSHMSGGRSHFYSSMSQRKKG
jgi:hypothetical protein